MDGGVGKAAFRLLEVEKRGMGWKRGPLRRVPAILVAALLLSAALFSGCGGGGERPLVLAATVDLQGFGILECWVDGFRDRTGRRVELVTVPDADGLEMAVHGECDLLLLHVPEEEERLERNGYLEFRLEVMRDSYLLVGPPDDPAGVREAGSPEEAIRRIATSGRTFLARSDRSGTAAKVFFLLGGLEAGQATEWVKVVEGDMEEVLARASREGAYTLADSSTFLRLAPALEMEALYGTGGEMADPYHVMAVSVLAYPDTDVEGARRFADYLLSGEARKCMEKGDWTPPE